MPDLPIQFREEFNAPATEPLPTVVCGTGGTMNHQDAAPPDLAAWVEPVTSFAGVLQTVYPRCQEAAPTLTAANDFGVFADFWNDPAGRSGKRSLVDGCSYGNRISFDAAGRIQGPADGVRLLVVIKRAYIYGVLFGTSDLATLYIRPLGTGGLGWNSTGTVQFQWGAAPHISVLFFDAAVVNNPPDHFPVHPHPCIPDDPGQQFNDAWWDYPGQPRFGVSIAIDSVPGPIVTINGEPCEILLAVSGDTLNVTANGTSVGTCTSSAFQATNGQPNVVGVYYGVVDTFALVLPYTLLKCGSRTPVPPPAPTLRTWASASPS
jgi:hypothetical protein